MLHKRFHRYLNLMFYFKFKILLQIIENKISIKNRLRKNYKHTQKVCTYMLNIYYLKKKYYNKAFMTNGAFYIVVYIFASGEYFTLKAKSIFSFSFIIWIYK